MAMTMANSRSDTARMGRSRAEKKQQISVPETTGNIQVITGVLAAPRSRAAQRKPEDEWAKEFCKWQLMPNDMDDQMAMAFHLEDYAELGPTEYFLKLSCPDAEQDDQRPMLLEFMAEAESTVTVTVVPSEEDEVVDWESQPRGWVHHQVWLRDRARSRTLPRQPNTILSSSRLEKALQQMTPMEASDGFLDSFYRRLVYIGDADQSTVTAIRKQASLTEAWALGDLFRGYFNTSPDFRLQVKRIEQVKVVTIIFNMPYLALGKESKVDTRMIGGRPLRTTYKMKGLCALAPDKVWPGIKGPLFMHECLMSVALNVRDDRWWDVFCLNDEFPFVRSRLEMEDSELDGAEGDTASTHSQSNDGEAGTTAGLQPVDLDEGDPIIGEGNGYTDQEPRSYGVKILASHLDRIILVQETLFQAIRQGYQAHCDSYLPRADGRVFSRKVHSASEVQEALDEVIQFLNKFAGVLKRQEKETRRFLTDELELTSSTRVIAFRHPLFIGLNKLNDLTLRNNVKRIREALRNLQHLLLEIEDLKTGIKEKRETLNSDQMKEGLEAQRESTKQGLQLSALHYMAQSLNIPLAIYNVSTDVTRLPHNSAGFALFTLGLTSLFLTLLFFTLMLAKMTTFLRWMSRKLATWWAFD
ncbi:hypothetical protein LIA77_05957 [Sarocladium implicatum]|nr:hypothetical protein LIA77_05957 [Sarocladium implicatum]